MKSSKTCASCGDRFSHEVLFCPTDGTPLSSSRSLTGQPSELDPYLEVELPGQIRLQALVGIGSMGRVYRAFQGGIDRDVAVKVLHRELTGNAELVGRFHREAKIASRLVHPNVVQVLLTGTLPHSADGRIGGEVYLVMEYLDGISLLSALAAQGEGGALPLPRALHIILQLCDAVGEAHAQGIVHRDLKPENIMLVRRGEDQDYVKVLDFGIARLDAPTEGNVTQAGLIFGTAKYISPEGAEGKTVGPQADVYAIATVLYQCLAGRTPFEGDTPMAVLMQQISAPPTDLRQIARSSYVPEEIAQVIMGNLVKRAADRAENARAFGRELELAARAAGISVDMLGGSSRGDLRLASKQRTKQHEFTADLKAKIASIPAGASRPITAFAEVTESGARAPLPAPPPPSSDSDVYDLDRELERRAAAPAPTLVGEDNDTIHGSLLVKPAEGGGRPAGQSPNGKAPASLRPAPTVPGSPLDDDPYEHARTSQPPPRASHPGVTATPGVTGPPTPGVSGPGARPSHPGGPPAGAPRSSHPGISSPGVHIPAPLSSRGRSERPEGLAPVPPARPAGSHAPSPSDGVVEIEAQDEIPDRRRTGFKPIALALLVLAAIPLGAFGAMRYFAENRAEDVNKLDQLIESAEEAMEKRAWDAPPGANVKQLTDEALDSSPGDRRVLALRRTAAERIVTDALGRKYGGAREEALRLARLALTLHPELATAQHLVRELEAPPATSADPAASASAPAPATARPGSKGPLGPRSPATGEPDPTAAEVDPPGPNLPPPTPPDITPPPPNTSQPWM